MQSKFESVQFITIDEGSVGQRIDNFLIRALKGVPKSRIYRIVRKGEVRVNKKRILANYRLEAGDIVRIPPIRIAQAPAPATAGTAIKTSLMASILFEDAGLLIINKPAGIAVHGGSGIRLGVIEILRQARPEASYLELVHRLDRETSGCLMIAKKRSVLRHLHELIRKQGMQKRYIALLEGKWAKGRHKIAVPLKKNVRRSGERIVTVDPEGKASVTWFHIVKHTPHGSVAEIQLGTGRTHQIRVHAAHAGHPIGGDDKYGTKGYNAELKQHGMQRLFLHAQRLVFTLPNSNEPITVEAPLPPELATFMEKD